MAVNIIPAALPATAGFGRAAEDGTGDDIRRKLALALAAKSMSTEPIQSPWQGAAQLAWALVGGLERRRLEQAEKADKDLLTGTAQKLYDNMYGGNGATPQPSAPTPLQPVPSPGADMPPPAPHSAAPAPTQMAALPASDGMPAPRPPAAMPQNQQAFIQSLMPEALKASQATGIDPRIIVGQAALESGFGKHAPGNNLFGIKSHGRPGGQTFATTEYANGQPVSTRDSFRAYASPSESVSDYANFLQTNPRYKPMLQAQGFDAQLAALGKSGYATDPNYAAKVGQIARGIQIASLGGGMPGNGAPQAAPGPQMAQAMPQQPGPQPRAQAISREDFTRLLQSRHGAAFARDFIKDNLKQDQKYFTLDGKIVTVDPRTNRVTPIYDPNTAMGQPGSVIPAPPPGVDPNIWRQEQSKNFIQRGQPLDFKEAASLRKEIMDLPSYKNYQQAFPVYRSMFDTAGRNTRASDLNLVYGLGKIFDPNSVVREGEMVMVKNTASLPDWLQGAINQVNGGAALQPDTRKAIMQEAHTRMRSYEDAYGFDIEHYKGITTRNRGNVDDVIPQLRRAEPWEPPTPEELPPPQQQQPQPGPQLDPSKTYRFDPASGRLVPVQ